jgi:hypothetical protein
MEIHFIFLCKCLYLPWGKANTLKHLGHCNEVQPLHVLLWRFKEEFLVNSLPQVVQEKEGFTISVLGVNSSTGIIGSMETHGVLSLLWYLKSFPQTGQSFILKYNIKRLSNCKAGLHSVIRYEFL